VVQEKSCSCSKFDGNEDVRQIYRKFGGIYKSSYNETKGNEAYEQFTALLFMRGTNHDFKETYNGF